MESVNRTFSYDLDCGHRVYANVEVRQQYKDDVNYILCPECETMKKDVYATLIATAWRPIVGVSTADELHDVFSRDAFVLPDRIMRLQPSVPKHRVRPFPYVRGARQ